MEPFKEIEVKILEIDVGAVKRKLSSLGAKKVADGEVISTYFNTPKKTLSSPLRLRLEDGEARLCHKKQSSEKKEGVKILDETEVVVDDFEKMRDLLLRAGLVETSSARKHRESYILGDMRFEIDTLPGIPTYLEIEVNELSRLEYAVKLLGFTMADTTPLSGRDILKKYAKRQSDNKK